MNTDFLWTEPTYQKLSLFVVLGLLILSGLFWFLKKKSPLFQIASASVQSWLTAAPLILIFLGLSSPWPLIFLVLISIFSAKIFFQMVGMYHRSWFVWTTYLFIVIQAWVVSPDYSHLYNYIPFVCMGFLCLVPLVRNSATHMIQYIALSTMAFIFFGWSLLHLARLLESPNGGYLLFYLVVLCELCQAISGGISKFFDRFKVVERINPLLSWEGVIGSALIAPALAWFMRPLISDPSGLFWLVAAFAAVFLGRWGNLTLAVIKKDLGIKNRGVFIWGRGDLLSRVDKYIFVGPMCYWALISLQTLSGGL